MTRKFHVNYRDRQGDTWDEVHASTHAEAEAECRSGRFGLAGVRAYTALEHVCLYRGMLP